MDYDANGSPLGFQYHGVNYATGVFDTYVYEKNLHGDIVAVYSSAGTKLVSYAYDAWGNFTVTYYNNGASTQAASNPFRYRGYYYDSDLGLYYLNSRYYDANTGRFISPDALGYLGANGDLISYNLYAYCSNNPVMYADPDGNFAISVALFVGSIVIGALTGGGIAAYSSVKNGDEWYEVGLKTISGAALGGMLGATMGLGASMAAGGTIAGLSVGSSVAVGIGVSIGGSALLGATDSLVNQVIDNNWNIKEVSASRVVSDASVAGIKGLLSFGTGAWTGAAGLWNIPKGSAPGFINISTRLYLNTVIGNGWKMSVDMIYEKIINDIK